MDARRAERRPEDDRPGVWGRSILLGVVVAALSVLWWVALQEQQRAAALHRTRASAARLAESLSARLASDRLALRELAEVTARSDRGVDPSERESAWRADLGFALEPISELEWVARSSPGSGAPWIQPPPDSPALSGRIAERVRERVAALGAERPATHGEVRTGPLEATPDGGLRLWLGAPVPRDGGWLVASVRLDRLFAEVARGRDGGHAVRAEVDGLAMGRVGPDPISSSRLAWWRHREEVPVFGLAGPISLELVPGAVLVEETLSTLPAWLLAAGLVIAALAAAAAALGQLAHQRARRLASVNADLRAENVASREAGSALRRLNRELESRVARRTAELANAVDDLEAFNDSVSHDLRSPLGAIVQYSVLLEEDCAASLDDAGREMLLGIRESAESALARMEGLRDLSSVGRRPLERREVDVAGLARRRFDELLAASPEERSVEFVVGALPAAHADAAMLGIVLSNLLSNALKFTAGRPHARIEVGHAVDAGEVVWFVRDDGVGFDPRFARKLFKPFERLHDGERFPGTGIGLATVARIVRRHGGRVWAESQPEKGATFLFTLGESEAGEWTTAPTS